jgi:2-dehydro-3-deoxygluconokinase
MTKCLLSIGECMVEMAAAGAGAFRQGFAGDTFNTAWYARRVLGPDWQVSYFTAVGDDAVSTRMLAFMEEQGVETAHVRRIKGRMPGLYLIDLHDGERSFTYWRETSAARALADDRAALTRAVDGADAIYFSGVTLAILVPDRRRDLLSVLSQAKARGALVGFDSNLRPSLWQDASEMRAAIRAAAKASTLALPTVPDEAELFQEPDAESVARRYLEDGVSEVVVKAGADPALIVWPEGRCLVAPETKIVPVDTTGAGDSFNGAYIAARLDGDPPDAAARRAHATAGRVIQAYGALV